MQGPTAPSKRLREDNNEGKLPAKKVKTDTGSKDGRDDGDRARRPSPIRERQERRDDPYREDNDRFRRREGRYGRSRDRYGNRDRRDRGFYDRGRYDSRRGDRDRDRTGRFDRDRFRGDYRGSADRYERRRDEPYRENFRDRRKEEDRGGLPLEQQNNRGPQIPVNSVNTPMGVQGNPLKRANSDVNSLPIHADRQRLIEQRQAQGRSAPPSRVDGGRMQQPHHQVYGGRNVRPFTQNEGWMPRRGRDHSYQSGVPGHMATYPHRPPQLPIPQQQVAPPHPPPAPFGSNPMASQGTVVPTKSLRPGEYEVVFASLPYGFGISPDPHGRNGIIGKVSGNQTKSVRIGSRIMYINGQAIENRPHAEILNVLKLAQFPVRITFFHDGTTMQPPKVVPHSQKRKPQTTPTPFQAVHHGQKQLPAKSTTLQEQLPLSNTPISITHSANSGATMNKTEQQNKPVVPLPATNSIELDEPMVESPIADNSSPPISPNPPEPPKLEIPNMSSNVEVKTNKETEDSYISSPSLSALSDDEPTQVKKKASIKPKRKARKKRANDTNDEKANQRALLVLVRSVKQALKTHKLAREDFKAIARKCSNKLFSNYKRKGGRKKDPRVWASKRKPKIHALVAKYVKLQHG